VLGIISENYTILWLSSNNWQLFTCFVFVRHIKLSHFSFITERMIYEGKSCGHTAMYYYAYFILEWQLIFMSVI